ncbi:MAG: site-specific integrase [Solirubrobacteraceae bacterium]
MLVELTVIAPGSTSRLVKRRAQAAGLPPTFLSGHSLRAGYGTAAAGAGVEERKITNVTRHRNLPVLRGYICAATAFNSSTEPQLAMMRARGWSERRRDPASGGSSSRSRTRHRPSARATIATSAPP